VRVVIDTNVIVAALLHPERTPDRALARIHARRATVLVDERIELEYRIVLARPKFASIDRTRRDALLERVLGAAEFVVAAPIDAAMIDESDRVFVEVARAGRADAIVTGNTKHFPPELAIAVWSPAELLDRLA
jgi:putative PIN family toxin of toxin-antitoxin system